MIPALVSGLILMKKRKMMEVFPPHLRKLWKEWELTGAALLSLTLQVVLIILGNRRKYCTGTWFRFVVWFAYMLADSVAALALGILSNDLGQMYDDEGHIDVANELRAFWPPFFLLHLGGPDTITAYSLEDNELYLRHLFGQIVQTTATLYILLLAWTSSNLSYLSIVVILVGCIKNGERTWALWKASRNNFRDSILAGLAPDRRYTRIMKESALREAEGYFVEIRDMEVESSSHGEATERTIVNEHDVIRGAHDLFQICKSLFADLIVSYRDQHRSQALFARMSGENAFKAIEIELGFMYDLMYTKAMTIYSPWGFVRRFITFFLTCLVFMFFILDDKLRHNRTHFVVTLLLLVVAIFAEIYAALIVLASDQTRVWSIKHGMTSISSLEEWFKWLKVQRWSNSIAQYSLLWLSLKEKLSLEIIEEFRYKEIYDFSTEYKEVIFDHVKKKFKQFKKQRKQPQLRSTSWLETAALREFCSQRGKGILDEYKEKIGQVNLEWSIIVDFDQSILIWHMATEICYYSEDKIENLSKEGKKCREFSLHMSRYMFYLLVICPSLLSDRIDITRIRNTRAAAMKFFREQKPNLLRNICSCFSVVDVDKRRTEACSWLWLDVEPDVPPIEVNSDIDNSMWFEACMLALNLKTISGSDPKVKWKLMRDMWLELLAYAACHSRVSQHGQQLRRGGELLTHVWLLMAHFGLTEQCQISQGPARATLVTK